MENIRSQTPYLVRALWQWCTDSGLSPQILVAVDDSVQVPMAYVVDERIVLDISSEATNRLELGDEWISFQARFGTKVENILVPMARVAAIFAEETQQGMGFEVIEPSSPSLRKPERDNLNKPEPEPASKARAASPLKIVK